MRVCSPAASGTIRTERCRVHQLQINRRRVVVKQFGKESPATLLQDFRLARIDVQLDHLHDGVQILAVDLQTDYELGEVFDDLLLEFEFLRISRMVNLLFIPFVIFTIGRM